jgi:hypothetical protein
LREILSELVDRLLTREQLTDDNITTIGTEILCKLGFSNSNLINSPLTTTIQTALGNSLGIVNFIGDVSGITTSFLNPDNNPNITDKLKEQLKAWNLISQSDDRSYSLEEKYFKGFLGELGDLSSGDVSDKTKELIEGKLKNILSPSTVSVKVNDGSISSIEFGIKLDKEQEFTAPLATDIGLPALGFDVRGNAQATLNFKFSPQFTVDKDGLVYNLNDTLYNNFASLPSIVTG